MEEWIFEPWKRKLDDTKQLQHAAWWLIHRASASSSAAIIIYPIGKKIEREISQSSWLCRSTLEGAGTSGKGNTVRIQQRHWKQLRLVRIVFVHLLVRCCSFRVFKSCHTWMRELSLPASLLISDDGGGHIDGTKDKVRAYGRVHIFEHGGQWNREIAQFVKKTILLMMVKMREVRIGRSVAICCIFQERRVHIF